MTATLTADLAAVPDRWQSEELRTAVEKADRIGLLRGAMEERADAARMWLGAAQGTLDDLIGHARDVVAIDYALGALPTPEVAALVGESLAQALRELNDVASGFVVPEPAALREAREWRAAVKQLPGDPVGQLLEGMLTDVEKGLITEYNELTASVDAWRRSLDMLVAARRGDPSLGLLHTAANLIEQAVPLRASTEDYRTRSATFEATRTPRPAPRQRSGLTGVRV